MPLPVVQVERIRIGALLKRYEVVLRPVHHAEIFPELGHDLVDVAHPPDHLVECAFFRRIDIQSRARFVVGHVEVEVAVAAHVAEGHRHAPGLRCEPRLSGPLREHAASVVHEQRHSAAQRADEQIEIAVSIYVGKDRARGLPSVHCHTGRGGDIPEPPAAEILVERVRALVAREVHVGQPVSVDVAQRHAATLHQMAVPERVFRRDAVDELNSGAGGGQLGEARAAARRRGEFPPAVAGLVVPDGETRGPPTPGACTEGEEPEPND